MLKRLLCLFILVWGYWLCEGNETDSLLVQLEQTMLLRQQYQREKELRIISMKNMITSNMPEKQRFDIHSGIIQEYIPFNFDSTLHYIDLNLAIARNLKNTDMFNQASLYLSEILASSGRYKEAIDIQDGLTREQLTGEMLKKYFFNYWKVYSELSFYTPLHGPMNRYAPLCKAYSDSLLKILDKNSADYLFIVEKELRDSRRLDECKEVNSRRLMLSQPGTRDYSIATFERAILCEMIGDHDLQKQYLILSALSDIRASIKDNASMTQLSMIFYKEKDIKRAYEYIQFSFADAQFFNSRLRFIEISNILSVINEAYQIQTDKQKQKLKVTVNIISLLSVVLLLALFYIYKQMKVVSRARRQLQEANQKLGGLNTDLYNANNQLNNLNRELSESNHVKEQYIGSFLAVCSNYIDKLDNYRKMVNKNIVARKVEELYEMTKSRNIIEEELKEFYENFDNTFLHIYPNFVEELNALLLEEERINLKSGELLNTELRIFALIRLGITDSSAIAGLLRYSVNTIYNYRVKIKNKAAVPREHFEDLVMKIGAFSK
jgi:hypothetical protein